MKPKAVVTTESKQFTSGKESDNEEEVVSSGNEWEAEAQKQEETKSKVKTKKKVAAKKTKETKKKKTKDVQQNLVTKIKKMKKNIEAEEAVESDQENESGVKMSEELEVGDGELSKNNSKGPKKDKKSMPKQTKQQTKVTQGSDKSKDQQSDGLRFLRTDQEALELNMVDESSGDENDGDGDTVQRMNIRDAFANDDVIEDFVQEKEEIVKNSTPNPVDLALPGWGDWAGAGIDESAKRKRKNQTKEPQPAPKRKDDGKANVIINEERNKKLSVHQVGDGFCRFAILPLSFTFTFFYFYYIRGRSFGRKKIRQIWWIGSKSAKFKFSPI